MDGQMKANTGTKNRLRKVQHLLIKHYDMKITFLLDGYSTVQSGVYTSKRCVYSPYHGCMYAPSVPLRDRTPVIVGIYPHILRRGPV
jgi:hypothetical protein